MARGRDGRGSFAALVVVVSLLAACGDGASAGGQASGTTSDTASWWPLSERADSLTTSTSVAPPTTDTSTTVLPTTAPPTTAPPTTAPPTGVTLPLLPTTTTTSIDRSFDPPLPVADPGGPPGRNSVMVVGDSVFLGTTRDIPLVTSHWLVTYDAVGNRRLAQAVDLFAARRHEIGEAVVIHLGNNYIEGERGDYAAQLDEVMGLLWFVPRVVWVTVSEVDPSRVAINEAIRAAPERWPNARVADWAPVLAANPQWSWDGLHLNHEGRAAIAQLVAQTLGPVNER